MDEVRQFYNHIEMQAKKGQTKKLKTVNSLDTEVTLSQIGESQIKISIKAPKEPKQNFAEQSRIQIAGIPQEEQKIRISNGTSKNLLKVPQVHRKKQSSLFDTHNFEMMLQSTNEEHMKMMISNTNVNQENNSRDLNETSILMLLNESIKQSRYKIQEQPKTSPIPTKLKEQAPIPKVIKKETLSGKPLAKQEPKKKLRKVNSDFQVFNQKEESVNKQEYFFQRTINNFDQIDNKITELPSPVLPKSKQQFLQPAPRRSRQPEAQRKSSKLEKQSSQSRLKLRDYIFSAQVTSAKALKLKRQRRKQKQEKQMAEKKAVEKQAKKPIPKYSFSNKQLCQILKEQINTELNQGIAHLNSMKNILGNVEYGLDPTNQELAKIFSLRKMIKDEVNKKLGSLVQKLTKLQGSNNQRTVNPGKPTEHMIHI